MSTFEIGETVQVNLSQNKDVAPVLAEVKYVGKFKDKEAVLIRTLDTGDDSWPWVVEDGYVSKLGWEVGAVYKHARSEGTVYTCVFVDTENKNTAFVRYPAYDDGRLGYATYLPSALRNFVKITPAIVVEPFPSEDEDGYADEEDYSCCDYGDCGR